MVRFKDVKVDPWLQNQGAYEDYGQIPQGALFACAYYVQTSPFTEGIEAVFLRRTREKDELWAATWDYEYDGSLPDYSIRGQYDSFGCKVAATRAGDAASASRRLLALILKQSTDRICKSPAWILLEDKKALTLLSSMEHSMSFPIRIRMESECFMFEGPVWFMCNEKFKLIAVTNH